MVSHITRSEYAIHTRMCRLPLGAGMHGEITAYHVQLPREQIGVGFVANGNEDAGEINLFLLLCRERGLNLHAGHAAVIAKHLIKRAMPVQFDFAFLCSLHQSALQNFLGAKTVAAVNQMHLGAQVAQIERFLYRGIAAAYDRHLLIAIEESVAGRASANAFAHKG